MAVEITFNHLQDFMQYCDHPTSIASSITQLPFKTHQAISFKFAFTSCNDRVSKTLVPGTIIGWTSRMLTSIKLIFGRMNYYVTIGRFGFTIYLRPVGVNKIRFQNRTTAHRRALFTGCRNPLDQQNDLQPFLIQNWLGEWENSVFWTKKAAKWTCFLQIIHLKRSKYQCVLLK